MNGRRLAATIVLSLLACGAVVAASSAAPRRFEKVPVRRLAPDAPGVDGQRLERQSAVLRERWRQVHDLLAGHHVSRRAAAEMARAGVVPVGGKDATPAVLRVLLVRIGFETDRAGDLTSVTTDGGFQLEPDPDAVIDPPPHDRAYFESHLFGLSEYYNLQSGGLLRIEGRVLPEGDQDCYRLGDIADYAPEGGWTLAALERLVQDMIAAADAGTQADGSASLADYDDDDPLTYIVFVHSGSDWQSDINQDSPYDIPTFFVKLGEPVALTSLDTETGQPGILSECSIIPETTTQDGFLGSIAGAMYHEFGHALGLVDVYDTSTGLPAAGLWDLMDSGPNLIANIGFLSESDPDSIDVYSVAGLLPPSLGIWNKWFLGWVEPAPLTGTASRIHLPAIEVPRSQYARWYSGQSVGGLPYDFDPGYPQAVVAGAAPREFFLLENRWVPETGDELPDQTGIGFVRDPDTGVFLYMGGDEVDPDGPGPEGVRPRNTGMYDFFLPAGGLLVWHVNEDRIESRLADNAINTDGDGLRLLEADGIQDVGVYEPYVIGFFGSASDPFRADNAAALTQKGPPSSRAYDRSWTGVELADISAALPTMTFTGRLAGFAPGTPWRVPPATGGAAPRRIEPRSATPVTVVRDGEAHPLLLVGTAAVVDTAGAVLEPPLLLALTDTLPPAGSLGAGGPPGTLWNLPAALAGPPVLVDLPGGEQRIVAVCRDGAAACWSTTLSGTTWDPLWGPATPADTVTAAPVVVLDAAGVPALVVPATGGRLVRLPLDDPADTSVVAIEGATGSWADPVVVPGPSGDALLLATADTWFLWDGAAGAVVADGPVAVAAGGTPRLGVVVDGERRLLLLLGERDLQVVAWDPATGLVLDEDLWTDPLREAPLAPPAVADLDGDGRDDIVLVGPTRVTVLNQAGAVLGGYPLVLADRFPLDPATRWTGACVVLDADGDGGNDLLLATDGGHLLAFDARGRLLPGTPLLFGDRGENGLVAGPESAPDLWLVVPGGRSTPGIGHRHVDGRVAGWRVAGMTATSAWLGPGGGALRRGTTGTPTAIAVAPAADVAGADFIVYPNPAGGDAVTFRYTAAVGGEVAITVFDLEGEQVARLRHVGAAGLVQELPWNISTLASGVYMCRLMPPGGGGGPRWTRLAVEH